MQSFRYIKPSIYKSCNYSTIGSIYTNFITAKTGTHSNNIDLNVLFRQSNIEPWECIKILEELYKNNCKFELSIIQRADLYNICNDLITGGLQNPLPLKTFISDPINTYFDLKFSTNRINTLLTNQIDINSPILLKYSTRKNSNIYLFPKDGIETVGSLNNSIRFENPFQDLNNKESEKEDEINLDLFLKSMFSKSDSKQLIHMLKYLYLMDIPLNLSILTAVSERFMSSISQLSPLEISESLYIFSSYFNEIEIPNVTNALAYHAQTCIYNLQTYTNSIVPSLYLLNYCKSDRNMNLKAIVNKLMLQDYRPDNFINSVRLQIILSLLDMTSDSQAKKLSLELNNQIVGHFSQISEPDIIHVARMLTHNFSRAVYEKLLYFTFENISDMHIDTVSSVYLYLSKVKNLSIDNNKIDKLLLHVINNVGSLSGGLIPDIYSHSIKKSIINESSMRIFEKNLLLNKKYLTSKDISNMAMSITFHGNNQNSVIRLLLDQFLHLKRHDRSKAQETLDNILAFSLAGVKHAEMWDNINLPIILNTVPNTLLVYIAYAFLITEFKCNICWSIIVERLLYENVKHSADVFKVLKIAQLMNYIQVVQQSNTRESIQGEEITRQKPLNSQNSIPYKTVAGAAAVILDDAAIQKFNGTMAECRQINLARLNSTKLEGLQRYGELLGRMGVSFEPNYVIGDLYLVSFYLPRHKIVLEIIKDDDVKITGSISGEILLKHKVIKRMGYNLIVVKSDWIDKYSNESVKKRIQLFYRKLGIIQSPKNTMKRANVS